MLNKVTLIGRLGVDPEVRYTPSGSAVTHIRLATSQRWKDKQTGEQREATEWHRIVFFNRLAEVAGEYLKKGSLTYVEGRIRTQKWQDQSGQDRYTTEIVAEQMKMLDNRSGGTSNFNEAQPNQATSEQPASDNQQQPPSTPDSPPATNEDFDDDIPF